jgi:hypothetical protein
MIYLYQMSPHNNARFNGSNIHSSASYHTGQNELAIAFGNGISRVIGFIYMISGLKFFYTRRIFKRGVEADKPFEQELLNIPLHKQVIGPNHGMVIHPSYLTKGQSSSPYDGGIKV